MSKQSKNKTSVPKAKVMSRLTEEDKLRHYLNLVTQARIETGLYQKHLCTGEEGIWNDDWKCFGEISWNEKLQRYYVKEILC